MSRKKQTKGKPVPVSPPKTESQEAVADLLDSVPDTDSVNTDAVVPVEGAASTDEGGDEKENKPAAPKRPVQKGSSAISQHPKFDKFKKGKA